MFTNKGFIDIAANLTDPMYKGIYNESQKHKPDLANVLGRAWGQGLDKIIITGTGLKESKEALAIARTDDSMFKRINNKSQKHQPDLANVLGRAWGQGLDKIIITGTGLKESKEALAIARTDERLFSTVGCHPTQCMEFEKEGKDKYLQQLSDLIEGNKDKVVAVGECGLDYDRLKFCPQDIQLKYFELQLELAMSYELPLFLHCRNAASDVAKILKKWQDRLHGGVVHSFDGSADDAQMFLSMGYYIGINGCSLKTEENLHVVKTIPSNRLLIETDAPWCEIRPSHASAKHVKTSLPSVKKEKWSPDSMVKGRNEPANVVQVLEVLAAVREENAAALSAIILSNTYDLFFPKSKK